jgi:hypothetical protein
VNITTTANDSIVLLPVIDGPLASCHKQVHFDRVQLNLNFSSLVSQGISTILNFPRACAKSRTDNQVYCLTIFLGADDIRTTAASDFAQDILATTLQDGPIDLICPDFNLTSAKTDLAAIKAAINSKIIRLATPLFLDSLFNQLCPGYS